MLYFMIAAGLTIILGVMNIVNLAHGTLFLLGSYIAFTFISQQFSFWVALLFTVVVVIVLGIIIERLLIQRVYGKELEQVLLTFGLTFVIADTAKWIWGTEMQTIAVPALLDSSIAIGEIVFPVYRLFVVLVGCILAVLLWY